MRTETDTFEAPRQKLWQENSGTLLCYPIILRNNDSEVLLLLAPDIRYSLPAIEIPRSQRIPPHLVPEVQRRWNVHAICRFSFADENHKSGPRYVVLDASDSSNPLTEEARWVSLDDIAWSDSESVVARNGFYATLRKVNSYKSATSPLPFTRPDWFRVVTDWVQSGLDVNDMKLSGRWDQYNMGPSFSLICYETNGAPVWFKAVGEPNLREYSITAELTRLRSHYVPQLLASHPGWHGWLMLDVEGQHLNDTADIEHWKTAARSLAQLQIESIHACKSLLTAGCEDLRTRQLRFRIEPFVRTIAQLMEMQPTTPPRILDRKDLLFVEANLRRAIGELELLGIPNTIGHSDLNSGNVLVNEDRAVFLDWMQSHIGQPLITFEYLLALQGRFRQNNECWKAELRHVYCQTWKSISLDDQMLQALKVTPMIAPFVFAVSCPGWNDDVRSLSPFLRKLMRTLARRIFVEAESFVNSTR